jgi:hypothetical protein
MRGALARFTLSSALVVSLGTIAQVAEAQQPAPAPAPAPSGAPADIGVAPAQPPPGQPVVVQPPAPAAKPKGPPRTEKEWYGWQVAIADVAALGLFVGGVASKTTSVADVGYATFLVAPPVVHFTHGNVGVGFGSFGLRLVVPPLFAGIGALVGVFVSIGKAENNANSIITAPATIAYGFVGGLAVGYLTAVGIDIGLLSWEKVQTEEEEKKEWGQATPKPKPWFTLHPVLDADAHRGYAGVGGTF